MSLTNECFQSVRHEGTPEGTIEEIGGVPCYVSTPAEDYPKDKVVLFLTDVFGLAQNNKLVADDFARNGFKTIVPDYLESDPIPPFDQHATLGFNREAWMARHGPAQLRPILDKVIAALKADGVTRIGTTGYCLGARYSFDLAFENITHVTIVSHPSRLEISDLEKYAEVSKAPLLINSCETDNPFPPEKQAAADKILGDKFAPGYKRTYADGCSHGFAVRADVSDPKVKAGKEAAFKASVEWFQKYL
ncbi:chlorocatechol-degradation protein [Punctularia strigosozonata HHB-11173 SS5]|uniref:Chlorocatechol-degradation protein n=1 Tax=Punctularia strigosozonata (strain HHB-11173) TaxID=741275 RepID=R7S4Y0_PUNST|nr:chlorocatechol-degradation protein [Punctularia strigosozonata HHB-11173 SS5]EIN05293.1 chlorocatechol-degradation protein [Punctularia strigosozonata HHB-11173 SS5]